MRTADLDFVDTYIMCHVQFTTSMALLEDLMARFHLQAGPGETAYFEKWQHSIQVKYVEGRKGKESHCIFMRLLDFRFFRVLSVLTRWIKLQYQDFEDAPILLTRLEAFLHADIKHAGFDTEADMIREALDLQVRVLEEQNPCGIETECRYVIDGQTCATTPLPSGVDLACGGGAQR